MTLEMIGGVLAFLVGWGGIALCRVVASRCLDGQENAAVRRASSEFPSLMGASWRKPCGLVRFL